MANLADLVASVHESLGKLGGKPAEETPPLVPAVPVKKSVTPDYIISREDGRKFKSLKRHLSTQYGMTPDEYRAKWGLPSGSKLCGDSIDAGQVDGAWSQAERNDRSRGCAKGRARTS